MNFRRLTILNLAALTLWVAKSNAQPGSIVNLDNVKQAVIQGQQVLLQTENGFGEISVYAPNIIGCD